jgi:hypothetical protein
MPITSAPRRPRGAAGSSPGLAAGTIIERRAAAAPRGATSLATKVVIERGRVAARRRLAGDLPSVVVECSQLRFSAQLPDQDEQDQDDRSSERQGKGNGKQQVFRSLGVGVHGHDRGSIATPTTFGWALRCTVTSQGMQRHYQRACVPHLSSALALLRAQV